MSTIAFDYAIDMSNSSAFSAGYVDREGGFLYLVFRESGSVVSHVIPDWLDDDTIAIVSSWGQLWNWHLKHGGERGPDVDLDEDEFVLRSEAPAETEADESPVVEVTVNSVEVDAIDVDRIFQVFVQRLTDSGWIVDNSADKDFRAALTAALDEIPTVQTAPVTALADELAPGTNPAEHYAREADLQEAVLNSEGTFLGIGFVNVPREVEHTLHSLLVSFNQFAQETVGEVESHVERYNARAMKNMMGGFR